VFRTLIVEDNVVFRESFREVLRIRFSHMVVDEAADGEEALQKVDTLQPDLIFMDIELPGENGLELTKKIKRHYPAIVIIILTNYDLPEYREAADQYGANHFISKSSSSRDDILTLVESILSDRGLDVDCQNASTVIIDGEIS
jgi:DNA-binding NarL/FixJ family response regulator